MLAIGITECVYRQWQKFVRHSCWARLEWASPQPYSSVKGNRLAKTLTLSVTGALLTVCLTLSLSHTLLIL